MLPGDVPDICMGQIGITELTGFLNGLGRLCEADNLSFVVPPDSDVDFSDCILDLVMALKITEKQSRLPSFGSGH